MRVPSETLGQRKPWEIFVQAGTFFAQYLDSYFFAQTHAFGGIGAPVHSGDVPAMGDIRSDFIQARLKGGEGGPWYGRSDRPSSAASTGLGMIHDSSYNAFRMVVQAPATVACPDA